MFPFTANALSTSLTLATSEVHGADRLLHLLTLYKLCGLDLLQTQSLLIPHVVSFLAHHEGSSR